MNFMIKYRLIGLQHLPIKLQPSLYFVHSKTFNSLNCLSFLIYAKEFFKTQKHSRIFFCWIFRNDPDKVVLFPIAGEEKGSKLKIHSLLLFNCTFLLPLSSQLFQSFSPTFLFTPRQFSLPLLSPFLTHSLATRIRILSINVFSSLPCDLSSISYCLTLLIDIFEDFYWNSSKFTIFFGMFKEVFIFFLNYVSKLNIKYKWRPV